MSVSEETCGWKGGTSCGRQEVDKVSLLSSVGVKLESFKQNENVFGPLYVVELKSR